ncbi:MAG TPA: DUF4965 domain-containing protein [Clostridia bacterium]|nr:DUF4965 domain-containing protein [Clostridia bacterium]HPO54227.1 DUF4965 domain-containing protein [Clostridia bacterium]
MRELRLPAYPVITIDPLFSIWSTSQKLYEGDTKMWTGALKPINGNIIVDGEAKRFMGLGGAKEVIPQKKVEIGLASTRYTFEDKKVRLKVTFTSPLLINDLKLASRPASYIDISVESVDGKEHETQVFIELSEKLAYKGAKKLTKAGVLPFPEGKIAYLGRVIQNSLSEAGDYKEINWGWLYLAGKSRIFVGSDGCKYLKSDKAGGKFRKALVSEKNGVVTPETPLNYYIVVGYDDNYSINYFGQFKMGYWKTAYHDIVYAVKESVAGHDEVMKACRRAEEELMAKAEGLGEDYISILFAAYRQVMAAGKIILEKDDPVLISKECGSNGCAATVDVSYPSSPLFLLGNPVLVKAMLIPIFKFARMRVWRYDFAPHDAGVYPYIIGQVYGAQGRFVVKHRHNFFKKYLFNCYSGNIYRYSSQMPVEECGNMLIMSAAYFNESGDFRFLRENADLLSKWADYLVSCGIMLENQLSTDDFGGRLENNVNLAIKSVIAIALWGRMLNQIQPGEGKTYLETAASFAKDLELRADTGDHTTLTIEDRESWSLKYNLVWDKIFGLNLFSKGMYEREVAFYKRCLNKYGVPLDSRKAYTKSDWLIWAACLDDTGEAIKLFSKAIADMLRDSLTPVPFGDWYDTLSAEAIQFRHRTVQGGLWMPLYMKHVQSGEGGNFLID